MIKVYLFRHILVYIKATLYSHRDSRSRLVDHSRVYLKLSGTYYGKRDLRTNIPINDTFFLVHYGGHSAPGRNASGQHKT